MPFIAHAASEADYADFARLFVELHVPEAVPDADRFATAIAPDSVFVHEGEHVAGYVWARTRGASLHVVHVVVAPAFRRRGVGLVLMQAAAARGRALGLSRWMLNVKPDNHAARALYTRCGMAAVMESASMLVTWAQLARVPGAAATTDTLAASDDAQLEAALGLSVGEIAAARSLPGRALVGAYERERAVGFAAYDPAFPGISPLRLQDARYAAALFTAARPTGALDSDHLHVFVEGLPALEAALKEVGATCSMRVLRMEGDVPAAPHGE